MFDFGYDVADYRDVDPVFGTLADLDRLVAEAHALGLRVLLDFVPNHTSSLHPWFLDARLARSAKHRDWYVWRDPAPDGGPPNDLESAFGGSAWTYDEATGQYWYHSFLPQQPELDWRNPAVREAMLDTLRFWFERGIDGFRIDVLRDDRQGRRARGRTARSRVAPSGPAGRPAPRPGARRRPRHRTPASPSCAPSSTSTRDRLLIGETYFPPERLVGYYGAEGRDGIHLPFNFRADHRAVDAPLVRRRGRGVRDGPPGARVAELGAGQPRPVAGRDARGAAQARVAAMLLLTLRGTPILYAGDELGLPDVPVPPERDRGRRRPGPGALADAVDDRPARRVHDGRAVAADGRGPRHLERRGAARRPALDAGAAPAAAGAPARGAGPARGVVGGRPTHRSPSSRSTGPRRAPGSASCSTSGATRSTSRWTARGAWRSRRASTGRTGPPAGGTAPAPRRRGAAPPRGLTPAGAG